MGETRTPLASRHPLRLSLLAAAVFAAASGPVRAEPPRELNGFALLPASIPADEIVRGGPSRDGIPALDSPPTVAAPSAPWRDDEWVVGVEWPGGARAYPLAILVWHELVNDTVGGRPILVSYCPLCGTAIVFDRRVGGAPRRFGVSGLLYRSDLLMFDRETESLWSQISAEAVTGPSLAQRLVLLRSKLRPWGEWRRAHPDTTVLSAETGHPDYYGTYGHSPYGGYEKSKRLLFPAPVNPRYHPKMRTVGLRLPDGTARGYPVDEVRRAGGRVEETFAGHPVKIRLDPESGVFDVEAPPPVEVIEGFWFAWSAFHPGGSVFVAP
jgi:hypothetical protein